MQVQHHHTHQNHLRCRCTGAQSTSTTFFPPADHVYVQRRQVASGDMKGREALRGKETRLIDLVFETFTSQEWLDWICICGHQGGREGLPLEDNVLFHFVSETKTRQKWAQWLRGPLEQAAAKGVVDLSQALVDAGADFGSALHQAARADHKDTVNTLLERGAPASAKDTFGRGALHYAADCGHLAVVSDLLAAGADANARDKRDSSPLDLAALGGHREIVRLFVDQAGADVDAVDPAGYTVLHLAAMRNNVEAINLLVEAGANTEVQNQVGLTPFHLAAWELHAEAAGALFQRGANVDSPDRTGDTPLHAATGRAGMQRSVEFVDLLLRWGADEKATNKRGRTPADLIGHMVVWLAEPDEPLVPGGTGRVRKLLANAKTDRTWRRRGFLVVCRAHPDRVQLRQFTSQPDQVPAEAGSDNLLREKPISSGASTESTAGYSTGVDGTAVVAKTLALKEDGVFRDIVGYL